MQQWYSILIYHHGSLTLACCAQGHVLTGGDAQRRSALLQQLLQLPRIRQQRLIQTTVPFWPALPRTAARHGGPTAVGGALWGAEGQGLLLGDFSPWGGGRRTPVPPENSLSFGLAVHQSDGGVTAETSGIDGRRRLPVPVGAGCGGGDAGLCFLLPDEWNGRWRSHRGCGGRLRWGGLQRPESRHITLRRHRRGVETLAVDP